MNAATIVSKVWSFCNVLSAEREATVPVKRGSKVANAL